MRLLGDVFRTVFIALVAAMATLFVIQNLAAMQIDFLLWSFEAPRFIGVLSSLLLGVVVGLLLRGRPRPAKR